MGVYDRQHRPHGCDCADLGSFRGCTASSPPSVPGDWDGDGVYEISRQLEDLACGARRMLMTRILRQGLREGGNPDLPLYLSLTVSEQIPSSHNVSEFCSNLCPVSSPATIEQASRSTDLPTYRPTNRVDDSRKPSPISKFQHDLGELSMFSFVF